MTEVNKCIVFDIGGSIVAPDIPDTVFLKQFIDFIRQWMKQTPQQKVIMVVGGGGVARSWQESIRQLAPETPSDSLDWVGIMATRLNAQLLRTLLGPLCTDPVVTDPTCDFSFKGRILVAAGWKPGFSTDYDAVVLAERYAASRIIMLSNIAQIYNADPGIYPDAQPLSRLSWSEYRAMNAGQWQPGANTPFDPVAARHAEKIGLTVVATAGRDINNLCAILEGRKFIGTVVAPDFKE